MPTPTVSYKTIFESIKKAKKSTNYNQLMINALSEAYRYSISELSSLQKAPLKSLVPGKNYFAFENGNKLSRPINRDLFDSNYTQWENLMTQMSENNVSSIPKPELNKILYSAAISFCAVIDLNANGDQKTPGTYFEYFSAFFYSWRLNLEPVNSIQIQNLDDEKTTLQTDYIFNLGKGKRKYHVPIKTSTRERAIMLWAHQKLIDGVYGTGRFMGTPVLLQETKLDKNKREVVEICLPNQWQMYQLYIAKLTRIYYLDPPSAYLKLNENFPPIIVKPFSEFFFEWDNIIPS